MRVSAVFSPPDLISGGPQHNDAARLDARAWADRSVPARAAWLSSGRVATVVEEGAGSEATCRQRFARTRQCSRTV